MQTYAFALPILSLGLMLRTPANAQEIQKYDPITEKRSDLRLKFRHDQRAAADAEQSHAQAQSATIRREYSGMVDFIALSAKRPDMRLRAAQIGYVNACEEWMRRFQPKPVNKHVGKASPGFDVPFTFDPLLQPKIVVRIRINGSAPLPFLLDTGLNAGLLIDTPAARQLHLAIDDHAPVIPIGALDVRKTHLNSVAFLGAGHAALPITAIDRAFVGDLTVFRASQGREALAGIIGIDALSHNAVRFDFASHKMTLFPETPDAINLPGASILTLQQHPGDACFFVKATLQPEIETELLLDTGSEGTGVPMAVAQHLHAIACKSSGTGTAYGLSIMPDLLVPSIRLGDCALDQVAVDSLPQTPFGYPMGLNLLARFRVTLDFPHRRMLIEHSAESDALASIEGYTGIHLASQGNRRIVVGVDPGSPAQQAEVQTGDVVTHIDGQATEGLPLLAARRLLDGFAGTTALLSLHRASGGTVQARFTRPSEFSRPALPIDGLFLDIPAHQPMEVVGLLPHCVGEKAGLHPGDVILEFNGQSTAEITSTVLAVEFRKTLLTLKVQRQGVTLPLDITLSIP